MPIQGRARFPVLGSRRVCRRRCFLSSFRRFLAPRTRRSFFRFRLWRGDLWTCGFFVRLGRCGCRRVDDLTGRCLWRLRFLLTPRCRGYRFALHFLRFTILITPSIGCFFAPNPFRARLVLQTGEVRKTRAVRKRGTRAVVLKGGEGGQGYGANCSTTVCISFERRGAH